VLLRYLGQLVAPITLIAEYSDYLDPVRRDVTDPMVAASLLCWVAMGAGVWWCIRKKRFVLPAAAAWFWLAILPFSNLLFPIATVRAERLLFVPSIGFVIAAAWLIENLARRSRVLAYAVVALVLAFYFGRTVTRNPDWKDRDSLWLRTAEQVPGSSLAWSFKGDILRDRGQAAEAEAAYRRSFELRDAFGFAAEAHNNYAQALAARGDRKGAEEQYRLVISKQPKQFTALTNLGEMLLHDAATRDESVTLLNRAIEAKPKDFRAHANLAQAHAMSGRYPSAIIAIDNAIAIRPNDPELWEVKASFLQASGKRAESEAANAQAAKLRAR
jgi:tetratricopeptide (TPR) repeat protein